MSHVCNRSKRTVTYKNRTSYALAKNRRECTVIRRDVISSAAVHVPRRRWRSLDAHCVECWSKRLWKHRVSWSRNSLSSMRFRRWLWWLRYIPISHSHSPPNRQMSPLLSPHLPSLLYVSVPNLVILIIKTKIHFLCFLIFVSLLLFIHPTLFFSQDFVLYEKTWTNQTQSMRFSFIIQYLMLFDFIVFVILFH